VALITDGVAPPVLRLMHALPADHRWPRIPGVTLPGDAAHLMAASGEGANLAMVDGAQLGKLLVGHPGDVEAALRAYEAALLGEDSPHSLLEIFTSQMPATAA